MKKNNKKGFTLAELLIVVAIIAVLVAIAIPVFTTQLEKSRESTDLANVRSGYAAIVTKYLSEGKADSVKVKSEQMTAGWQNNDNKDSYPLNVFTESGEGTINVSAHIKGDSYVITVDANGSVSVK